MRLSRVFRAAVLGVSATRCGETLIPADASVDASTDDATTTDVAFDVVDAGSPFVTDSSFEWCEAGPPQFLGVCGSCCKIMSVPCPIPPGDFVGDSSALYFCDRYCGADTGQWGCEVVDAGIVSCGCTGRRFEGYADVGTEGFAKLARLEAASVFAFERLHDELSALGASPPLLARVRRAVADEKRHTRLMTHLARQRGERVELVCEPTFSDRAVEAIAIENATEGCVRELFGALVATWHGTHARDRALRRTFRVIARDETRHAELALRVAAFLSCRLDAKARARVKSARADAVTMLAREVAKVPHERALFDAVLRAS
ncbi:MAG TPA: ferritin-like domain-containing protein [Polyangiaceae bacterium]|jgi:hypothetical protein